MIVAEEKRPNGVMASPYKLTNRVKISSVKIRVSKCWKFWIDMIKNEQNKRVISINYWDIQPPAISTHWLMQLPSFPSTSGISVSHRHRQPTPFSWGGSGLFQYSSSSLLFFSSSIVISRYGGRGLCLAGALAGQCWMVVCLYPKSRK